MAYRALFRKYRPQKFSEVVGQEIITQTLRNAVKKGLLSHAYIFAGPRGVGKTTTARIVAKAVNCENPQDGEPCNQCLQCLEIVKGSHPDVIEVDAASNRGIDQIRELRESVHYLPVKGKRKVYIIDEFHMLTKEAFNALLKTLEEPPEHVLFILATTEIDKIPPTILSRCQKFIFRRVPQELVAKSLARICESEGVEYDEEALKLIAVYSEGCMRDAESLLEQAIAVGGGKVEVGPVSDFLGILTGKEVKELLKLGFEGNKEGLFKKLRSLEERGYSPVFVMKQLLETVKKEFLSPSTLTEEETVAAFEILSRGYRELSRHPYPYTSLLFHLYKLSYFKEVKKLSELLSSGLNLDLKSFSSSGEKKTKSPQRDTLSAYIAETKEVDGKIVITPVNQLAYKVLSERGSELKKRFGKEVLLLEPEVKRAQKEISDESRNLIKKLTKELDAKVLYLKVKEDEGPSS
ncbi:DNA polymerase III subunit gamma/tau [Thermovibrio sp.]